MRITIIPIDKSITINDRGLVNIQQDLSWIPENIHAVQWYHDHGEIEFNDGSPNEKINDLGIYWKAIENFNTELFRLEEEIIKKEETKDYWTELRLIRNIKLLECDWTQLSDSPLSENKKNEWKVYRQKLRDLIKNTFDPKNPIWPISPD